MPWAQKPSPALLEIRSGLEGFLGSSHSRYLCSPTTKEQKFELFHTDQVRKTNTFKVVLLAYKDTDFLDAR